MKRSEEYPFPRVFDLRVFESVVNRFGLTRAERRAVCGVLSGLGIKDVGFRLGKHPRTVQDQLRSARARMEIHDTVSLCVFLRKEIHNCHHESH